jgi:hypothetical protein
VREAFIYSRQVRKQARDVVRWGRRTVLRDGTPRDLGVPIDQLRLQQDREVNREAGRPGPRPMATAAERGEAGEPPA